MTNYNTSHKLYLNANSIQIPFRKSPQLCWRDSIACTGEKIFCPQMTQMSTDFCHLINAN